MTSEIPSAAVPEPAAPPSPGRAALTVRALGYLLPTLPIVLLMGILVIVFVSVGAGLTVLYVGLFLLMAGLWIARAAGTFELARLRAAGLAAIQPPSWPGPLRRGHWASIGHVLLSADYWRYAVHAAVNMLLGSLSWAVAIAWTATILNGASYWFWSRFLPAESQGLAELVLPSLGIDVDPVLANNLFNLGAGALALLTLPWVMPALVSLHHALARLLLSRSDTERLQARLEDASASRSAAVTAEGQALRRLERDIHDGPQQQLLRIQMDLAAAGRRLSEDPDAAARLIEEAGARSAATLEELRGLARGFAPPLLQDRGLVVALESLVERSTVPVRLTSAVPSGQEIPASVQQGLYFVVSELLVNAAKHSGAQQIAVTLSLLAGEPGEPSTLIVDVQDDGRGGASIRPGGGLAGLADRVRGLAGRLSVHSPSGGPTLIRTTVPLEIAAG